MDEEWWNKLLDPLVGSGFWKWEKRYDAHRFVMYSPSWSFNLLADSGWYYSSGDGEYPEGFMEMLRGLMRFSSEIEGLETSPVVRFLAPITGSTEA